MSIRTIPQTKWFPVFTAGKHIDMNNRVREWTDADLDLVVAASDPAHNDAPLVFGHPKTDAPRYGTVDGIKRVGKVLYARAKDVAADFADAVAKKLYPDRSISIDQNTMRITHIGFLGAVPPAIEGLPPAQFSASGAEDSTYNFSAAAMGPIARMFQSLRELILSKVDLDTVNKAIEQWETDSLKQMDTPVEIDAPAAFAAPEPPPSPAAEERDVQELEQLRAQVASFTQAVTEKDARIAELTAANATLVASVADMNFARTRTEAESYCNGLVAEGKLTPAQRDAAMPLFEVALKTGDFQFASPEMGKKAVADVFKGFLASLPKQVTFGETPAPGTAALDRTNPSAIAKKAEAYVFARREAGEEISISDAVKHVMCEAK